MIDLMIFSLCFLMVLLFICSHFLFSKYVCGVYSRFKFLFQSVCNPVVYFNKSSVCVF